MSNSKRLYNIEIVLFLLLIISFVFSIVFIPHILLPTLGMEKFVHILLKIRLPENLAALAVGLSLGLSGAVMQIVLNNNLASPFTLGVSSAASCGAAVSIVLFNSAFLPLFAISFSLFSFVILLSLSSVIGGSRKNIIIAGISVNYLFSSLRTILISLGNQDNVYQIIFWNLGSLSYTKVIESIKLLVLFLVFIFVIIGMSSDMGLIQQGDAEAKLHGVNVKTERNILILLVSILTAISVSYTGVISFVGLCSVHIARLLVTSNPKHLVISSTLVGGMFLILSNVATKVFTYPAILPLSSVTSFLGILLLLLIVLVKKRKNVFNFIQ